MTWQRLRKGLRHNATTYSEVWDIDVSPFNRQFIIAAITDSPGPIDYPGSPAGVYIRTYESGTGGLITFGLNMDEPSKSMGFLRSEDGGENWTAFAPSKPNLVYLATKGYNIYKSTDSGLSYSHLINLRSADILN